MVCCYVDLLPSELQFFFSTWSQSGIYSLRLKPPVEPLHRQQVVPVPVAYLRALKLLVSADRLLSQTAYRLSVASHRGSRCVIITLLITGIINAEDNPLRNK